jgi:hypothetical protein
MRRYSLTMLMVLLVIALGLGAVACGSGSGANNQSPEQMLTASVTAAKAATSQTGDYEIDLTVAPDTTQSTADANPIAGVLFAQPIKVTGTFASQESPARTDLTVGLNLMGTTMSAGLRNVDAKSWANVLGQWYEMPADSTSQAGGADAAKMSATIRQAMDEEGIDFNTWVKDLKAVGQETLVDTKVTHLAGKVDVKKMVADIAALMQNPKVAQLMATAGSTTTSETGATVPEAAGSTTTSETGITIPSATGITIPDAAGIAETQATVENMIQSATIDLWVAQGDSSMRKMVFNAKITVPAELGTSGVSGATVVFTINLAAPNKAVDVKTPESTKPFAELQTDLQSNSLFGGLLGGFMGSGSGAGGLLGQ